ncbi:MAG: dual specificity protein phosphatase [Thermodesulfobacteriota bacterium]|nr:dual specificity protein phosphatase [Thermodesulfobacteriota bacterium]
MEYILDRLAIGDIDDARNLSPDIGAILNCAAEHDTYREGIFYLKIPLIDFEPIEEKYIPVATAWIKEKITHNSILIHCNAGISRSASIAACYLYEIGFGFKEAKALIISKKNDVFIDNSLEYILMNLTTKKV